jgi:hypothetical protein
VNETIFHIELAREFRTDPFGPRSPGLTRLLNQLRTGPMAGRHCLVCTQPHAEWRLARLSGVRGAAPTIEHNRVFHSLAEAEWAVFKLRWEAAGGPPLDDDAL